MNTVALYSQKWYLLLISLLFYNEFCFKNKSNDAIDFIAKAIAIEMHIALWRIASHRFKNFCQVRKE